VGAGLRICRVVTLYMCVAFIHPEASYLFSLFLIEQHPEGAHSRRLRLSLERSAADTETGAESFYMPGGESPSGEGAFSALQCLPATGESLSGLASEAGARPALRRRDAMTRW